MNDEWRDRLRKRVKELQRDGVAVTTLSEKAGQHRSWLKTVIDEGSTVIPRLDALWGIAEACGMSVPELLGTKDAPLKIQTLGVVNEAERWSALSGVKDAMEFDVRGFDLVGFEVRGNAMAPVYRDQDYLICQRRAGRFVQNLVGSDCVVETASGDRYLKILNKGTRPGAFTLRSYNPTTPDVENVVLDWAAPVIWIKRGGR